MSDTVISVEHLSKTYRLGTIGGGTLRADVSRWMAKLRGKADPNLKIGQEHLARLEGQEFRALQDVSFEVKQGEILGIIGRNGAGKSTLLKILSRVTAPTSGEVKVKGRIASLLEVGTGFHPELTGRENIFLNGAILGMTKFEIRRKFDEIVAFSGVEEFIDTPVKRYSSGMYVRLAFAVAAHLEPEILIVDEVLAVGDAEFQKKCMGKMQEVSQDGRTILFVSHSLDSIIRLCSSALWMDAGRVRVVGNTHQIVDAYQQQQRTVTETIDLTQAQRPQGFSHNVRFTQIKSRPSNGRSPWNFVFRDSLVFDCAIQVAKRLEMPSFAFAVFSSTGFEIASSRSDLINGGKGIEPGNYQITVELKKFYLAPGIYKLNLGLRSEFGDEDFIPNGPLFEISTNQKAANLLAETIRAACIPDSEVSLSRLT
jgi:lipopolysaccharide transport system ATP-binding protein